MDEFEKWLDSQPILLQKNLSESDEAMKRDAFTAGRKSGYEAGLRRAARLVDDDAAAMSFQSMGHYRTVLRDAIIAEIRRGDREPN